MLRLGFEELQAQHPHRSVAQIHAALLRAQLADRWA
jgi:hypothetical protein